MTQTQDGWILTELAVAADDVRDGEAMVNVIRGLSRPAWRLLRDELSRRGVDIVAGMPRRGPGQLPAYQTGCKTLAAPGSDAQFAPRAGRFSAASPSARLLLRGLQ